MILKKIKSLQEQYLGSTLSKNIFTVFSGTAISQLIQVIGIAVLALCFSTSEFGVFALYTSFASLLSIVATARYEMAIVLPQKKEDAKILVTICLAISFLVSLFSLVIIYPLRENISLFFSSGELAGYLLFVPLSVLFTGTFQTFYNYGLREKKFRALSIIRIWQTLLSIICPVALWFYGYKTEGLIVGYIISQFISVVLMLFITDISFLLGTRLRFHKATELLIAYKNFPGINSLHAFSDNAQSSALNFIISYSYGNAALGLFAIAFRVLRAPAGVVSAAVSQVLFQQMSENYYKGISNYRLCKKTIKYLTILSIPLFLIIAIACPPLFKIFFTPQWAEAGAYIIYLSPWVVATFISAPLSHLPNITSKQLVFLLITIGINLIAFTVFYIIYLGGYSIFISLLGFSFAWCLGVAVLLIWFSRLAMEVKGQNP